MKLTKTAIEKFEYKGTATDIRWDDQITGLGVRRKVVSLSFDRNSILKLHISADIVIGG